MAGHRFQPEHADKLMSDERREMIPPETVIEFLKLDNDDSVADLGSGNGYFTIPMAKKTEKNVYAVDIEPRMLEMLKGNAEKEHIENIQYVISDLENIQLHNDSVNKVLTAFVIHEVPNITQALDEMKRILKPGGELFLLEWKAVDMEMGPPLHERISSKNLLEILKDHGFYTEVTSFNSSHYAVKAVPFKE